MDESPGTGRPPVTEPEADQIQPEREADQIQREPEAEQIQREIEQTREELGDTVEALAHKTDVKAQAKERIDETKATVSEKTEQILGKARDASPEGASAAASQAAAQARENPAPVAAIGAFAAGFLIGRLSKRRR